MIIGAGKSSQHPSRQVVHLAISQAMLAAGKSLPDSAPWHGDDPEASDEAREHPI